MENLRNRLIRLKEILRKYSTSLLAGGAVIILVGLMIYFSAANHAASLIQQTPLPSATTSPVVQEAVSTQTSTPAPSAKATVTEAITLKPTITPSPTTTPLVCTDADREAIREALSDAFTSISFNGRENISSYNGYLHYETNGPFPPAYSLRGITAGETKAETFDGVELELARVFYLDQQDQLRWLWLVTGFVNAEEYHPMNLVWKWPECQVDPLSCGLWSTREQAAELFASPGIPISLIISDWYVWPNVVRWEDCKSQGKYTDAVVCDLGLALELQSRKGGSAAFFETQIAPDDWVAFGWLIERNILIDKAKLPGSASVCR